MIDMHSFEKVSPEYRFQELTEDDIYYLSSPIPYTVDRSQKRVGIHIGIGNRTEMELKDVKAYFYLVYNEATREKLLCETSVSLVPAKQSYFGKIGIELPENLKKGRYQVRYTLSPGMANSEKGAGSISLEISD
jgi:hypothetical protein